MCYLIQQAHPLFGKAARDLHLDYEILRTTSKKEKQLRVVAAHQTDIAHYQKIFSQAALLLSVIDVDALAMAFCLFLWCWQGFG